MILPEHLPEITLPKVSKDGIEDLRDISLAGALKEARRRTRAENYVPQLRATPEEHLHNKQVLMPHLRTTHRHN